ncbi:VPS4-associated protein 1 [Pterulicium gracile]|uniref:VPS4-associated protein 1 n=1 Tax=Pterulicium gracile TaxID=1884261 RepID=A0A5C3QJD5_9AGAR|nr:VPS4-associated protein 1 [Pterula gracilis]
MSFTNLYYKRTAATEKACFVCFKPTPLVLATAQTVDFFYVCPGHLTDRGFASPLSSEPEKPQVGAEEIAKVKQEWEDKQKAKKEKADAAKEKEKDSEKDGDKKGKDPDESTSSNKADTKWSRPAASTSPSPAPSGSTTPKHERYALHRDFYAMRQTEHRKRRQTAQAKQLAPQLPRAPRGNP